MEVTWKQSKNRELSLSYLALQQNTEPLTNVHRLSFKKSKCLAFQDKAALSREIVKQEREQHEFKSFIILFIQLTYLLFSCYLKRINIYIGKFAFRPKPSQFFPIMNKEVWSDYLLEAQFQTFSAGAKEKLLENYTYCELTKSSEQFSVIISNIFDRIHRCYQATMLHSRNQPNQMTKRSLQILHYNIEKNIQPFRMRYSQKKIMEILEQTEVFRQNSMLLKIVNNSILRCMDQHPNKDKIYSEVKKLQNQMNQRQNRNSNQFFKITVDYIERLVSILVDYKIFNIEFSFNQKSFNQKAQKSNEKNSIQVTFGKTSANNVEYKIKFSINEQRPTKSGELLLNNINEKRVKNHFLLEIYQTRLCLVLRYVTNIQVTRQNYDLLIHQSQSLSNQWENISIQMIQTQTQRSKFKQTNRYICLKIISLINLEENLLLKLFYMIDILIIFANISEPYMRKNFYSQNDHQNKQILFSNCQHLFNLFTKRNRKRIKQIMS